MAPGARDRGADAPGEPASDDEQPARTPASVRLIAAMVWPFMITSVKSGVVIDRDGGLGAVLAALGGDRPGGSGEAAGSPGYRAHRRFLSAAWVMPSMVGLRAEGPKPGNP